MRTPKESYDPAQLAVELADANWFNNSDPGGSCVDVAFLSGGMVGLRDSKLPGFASLFTPEEWDVFVAGAKAGKFDRPGGEGSTN